MNATKLVRACVQKLPSYIPGKPIEEVEREFGLSGVIKMASNENPLQLFNDARISNRVAQP